MKYDDFNGVKCHVLGLGRSNIALCEYLQKQGAHLSVSDKKKSKEEIKKILQRNGIQNFETAKYGVFNDEECIFRTPSIHPCSPFLIEAKKEGRDVTSETELFFKVAKGRTYAITGSDGKTTTTTIAYELLKEQYGSENVFIGGNIGIPLISLVDKLNKNSITVCELSSFQLIDAAISPDYCAITNITENHLDYHADLKEYISAKCRIFQNGTKRLTADAETLEILKKYANVSNVDVNRAKLENGKISVSGDIMLKASDISVRGAYNTANFMTAIALTYPFVSKESILSVAKNFHGVEHRNEFVCRKNGVDFYNCSIDSTPSRTLATLSCHKEDDIVLICGGYDKNLDYSEFANALSKRIKQFILIGANRNKIYDALKFAKTPEQKLLFCSTLSEAVKSAYAIAQGKGSVILSPASASFDMFKNFEERGCVFKNIIKMF